MRRRRRRSGAGTRRSRRRTLNCSGLTKIDATTRSSPCVGPRAIRRRWPSCSAPIVGTTHDAVRHGDVAPRRSAAASPSASAIDAASIGRSCGRCAERRRAEVAVRRRDRRDVTRASSTARVHAIAKHAAPASKHRARGSTAASRAAVAVAGAACASAPSPGRRSCRRRTSSAPDGSPGPARRGRRRRELVALGLGQRRRGRHDADRGVQRRTQRHPVRVERGAVGRRRPPQPEPRASHGRPVPRIDDAARRS